MLKSTKGNICNTDFGALLRCAVRIGKAAFDFYMTANIIILQR